MVNEWREVSLWDIAHYINGRATKPSELCGNDGVPVIKIAELNRGITEQTDRIPEELVASEHWVKDGDLLFAWSGSIGIYRYRGPKAALNQHIFKVIAKSGYDQLFVRYLLLSQLPIFESHVEDKKTTMGHVTVRDLQRIKVSIPPLPEQRAIAHILGTLDDKIELNRLMSQTLEQMARALFKAWFVDFEPVRAKMEGRWKRGQSLPGLPAHLYDLFPNRLVDSELGEIPEGWRIVEIGDIAHVIDCLHSKKPERKEAGLPLLQLWNIRDDGLIDMTDTYYIDEADYEKWITRMEASPGDCVITNVGRVGAVAQIPDGLKAALGRNMTGIRCKSSFPFPTFIIECLRSEAMRNEITLKMDTGTILEALNVRNIPKLRLVLPHLELLRVFEQSVKPLRARMELNLLESHTLATLRDTLLPKLISGELRVKDAERFLKERGL